MIYYTLAVKSVARRQPPFIAARRRVGGHSRTGERYPNAPARQRALAFVRAFLHYQVGDTGPRTRAALAGPMSASSRS